MSFNHRTRRNGGADDAGFSIVEIIVSIVLMGTVVVATMNAVGMSVRASATSRSAAKVETAIVNASDRVNRATKDCDYTRFAQAAVQTEGWAADRASVVNEYYIPAANPLLAGTWATGTAIGAPGCPGASATDLLVQRVTITITSPDGKVRRSIQVVKSDV